MLRWRSRFVLVACSLVAAMAMGLEVGAQEGSRAPQFTLRDLSGQSRSLPDLKGKVVVLDFWATWCPPCRASIRELVKLQQKHQDKGLVVLGISVDDPQMASDKQLNAFAKKQKMNYPVLRASDELMVDYFGKEAPLIPTAFIVDREGMLRGKILGFRPGAIEKIVAGLLD